MRNDTAFCKLNKVVCYFVFFFQQLLPCLTYNGHRFLNVTYCTYVAYNLWPWFEFLQVCFRIKPGKEFFEQNSWATFSLNENYIPYVWGLDSTFFPLPISAHTSFFSTLYCHMLDIGNSAILFWGSLSDNNTHERGPWPKRASWFIVTQHIFSSAFGDCPCVFPHRRFLTWACAYCCNIFPTETLFQYSWAHIIINF